MDKPNFPKADDIMFVLDSLRVGCVGCCCGDGEETDDGGTYEFLDPVFLGCVAGDEFCLARVALIDSALDKAISTVDRKTSLEIPLV